MRGDFSSFWNKEDKQNFNGVLHQQGRVLLDRDWNAQTEILNDWQETAAQDIIGAGVAAVPSDAADSFKVTEAKLLPGKIIKVSVNKGRVWADGLPLSIDENIVLRDATYLQPPIQDPPGSPENLKNKRDAVILETWLEELNAFQKPELLIEPALGGVDTTERIHKAFRFRLFRMDGDDRCDSIIGRLRDNFENKGRLTVVLQPGKITDGDCPVVEGGGYTGFEHQLYRIEIARTKHSEPYFKWSQFNGGLVGRGKFNSGKVTITANLNAILHSGLTDFYLETLEEIDGYWQVTYGAKVTLDTSSGSLNLPATTGVFFGVAPTTTVFFRLWNDIRPVVAEADLQDGIRLKFGATGSGKYMPHDFWTFPVRAGEIPNDPVLINDKPSEGIFYHRVPLAELLWRDDTLTEPDTEIDDCRRIFAPLTKLKTCCTYRVGDGVNAHGDFTSIQTAIDALPKTGGEICVLPGFFEENIKLEKRNDIVIKGCGNRTVISGSEPGEPVILIDGGTNLRLENFQVQAEGESVGILLEGNEIAANVVNSKILQDIELEKLQITAATRSAIEMHVGQFVSIRGCKIFIKDVSTEYAAVQLAGDDLLFEENEIRVMSGTDTQPWVKTDDPLKFKGAKAATGGLHLNGGCERVRVIKNLIMGGTGNGINLGNIDEITPHGIIFGSFVPWWLRVGSREVCNPNPGAITIGIFAGATQLIAGAPLQDIRIERNRILCMGRNGIGVDGFFARRATLGTTVSNELEMLSVENLVIVGNTINNCLNLRQVDISSEMTDLMGYGGIALADVENLDIRDNFITDNGASYLNPTCGIYVLHGTGIEISRNQIVNNGKKTAEVATSQTVRNGNRGGIVIGMATQPTTPSSGQLNGIPAAIIRENVVAVPMGRALTATAMGDVSVTGNRFLTQSVVPGEFSTDRNANHIQIFNLSVSMTLQYAPFRYQDTFRNAAFIQPSTAARIAPASGSAVSSNTTAGITAPGNVTAGTDLLFGLNPILQYTTLFTQILKRGTTLFAHNQCQLISQTGGRFSSRVDASIRIIGSDDVAFLSNQCVCILVDDHLIFNTLLFGNTLRANDNLWQELNGTVSFSAFTLGQKLNTTTDNQATHCVIARGGLYLDKHNLTLFDFVTGYSGNVLKIPATVKSRCQRLFDERF